MRVSYLWLKDFVKFSLTPGELAELLTMAGLEVASLEPVGPELEGITVGQVLEVRKHPQADRLSLCRVDLGEKVVEVVCGAPNVAAGQKIAFISAGTALPDGRMIEARSVRGVRSEGMICSGKELQLSEDAEGILVLAPAARVGSSLRDLLGPRDWALDLEVTLNRPDCLSHLGVAREIAAALRLPLIPPRSEVLENDPAIGSLTSVEVLEPALCPRYSARVIRGVKVAPSPDWLRWRLEAAGLRAINNVVDVTNYILLELGHPLHAFDFHRLEGQRICVRCAEKGEKFVTLDGQQHMLDDRMLLICDGQRGVALAGIMGGENSEISQTTTNILLESAYFDPVNTRRTSKLLALSTDSSRRFERGADPNATIRALDRAAGMILQLAGGVAARGAIDVYPAQIVPRKIGLRCQRVQHILGIKLPKVEIGDHLTRLGCAVSDPTGKGDLSISVPTYRPDLDREIDLIEEVARLHGYDDIPTSVHARVPLDIPHTLEDSFGKRVRDVLVRLGLIQVQTSSLIAERETAIPGYPAPIKLRSPASEDMAYLRNGLLPGLLKTAAYNLNRDLPDLRIFEIGRAFCTEEAKTAEWESLGGILTGTQASQRWDQIQKKVDFLDLKGLLEAMLAEILLDKFNFFYYAIEHSTADALQVRSGERVLGYLGQVHPAIAGSFAIEVPVFAFELRLAALQAASASRLSYQPFPKFPPLERDLAFVLADDVPAGEILQSLRSWGGEQLVGCELFDVYRGEQIGTGMKGLAFRLKFQSITKTLTDAEAEAAIQALIGLMAQTYQAKLRS